MRLVKKVVQGSKAKTIKDTENPISQSDSTSKDILKRLVLIII